MLVSIIAFAGSNIHVVNDINMKGSKVSVIAAQAAENTAEGIKYVSDKIAKEVKTPEDRFYGKMVAQPGQ
ncbi:hypothetical protein [Bartonella apihabitans]|uniref:hypothetical protein n=1 Tax=Bartonella apihabitans TaxID=2750929 RepID=UPI003BB7CB59